MKNIFIFLCFLFPLSLLAQKQNLITNGGFELSKKCPQGTGQFHLLKGNWFKPNSGTPDYFDTCAIDKGVGIPYNFVGYQKASYQKAKSGKAYVGILSYMFSENDIMTDPNVYNREYVATKLTKHLKKGYFYKLTFFLNLSNTSPRAVSRKDIGAYFAKDTLASNSFPLFILPFQPQVVAGDTNSYFEDTLDWAKVEMTYKAKGGEKFMTIGNFNKIEQTHVKILDSSEAIVLIYYYIDDVSLYEVKKKSRYGLKIDSLQFLVPCYDSLKIKLSNNGDSLLDFTQHPVQLTLALQQEKDTVQILKQTIIDNQLNPKGLPLAKDSSIWIHLEGLNYSGNSLNYKLSVEAKMAADSFPPDNFIEVPALSVAEVSANYSTLPYGAISNLYTQNIEGEAH